MPQNVHNKYKGDKMRKLISGLIGAIWGGALISYWGIISEE